MRYQDNTNFARYTCAIILIKVWNAKIKLNLIDYLPFVACFCNLCLFLDLCILKNMRLFKSLFYSNNSFLYKLAIFINKGNYIYLSTEQAILINADLSKYQTPPNLDLFPKYLNFRINRLF